MHVSRMLCKLNSISKKEVNQMFRITVTNKAAQKGRLNQTSFNTRATVVHAVMNWSVDFCLRFDVKLEMHMSHMNVVGVANV